MAVDDRQAPLLLDAPELRTARLATVALLAPIDKSYTYAIPDELAAVLRPGMRLMVPFGTKDRPTLAYCIDVSEGPWNSTLKPVSSVVDERPLLDAKLLELGRWIARYYMHPLGRTLHAMVPAAAKRRSGWRRIKIARLLRDEPLLPADRRSSAAKSSDADESAAPRRALTARHVAALAVLRELAGRTPPGEPGAGEATVQEWRARARCGDAVVKALEAAGFVRSEVRRVPVEPSIEPVELVEPGFGLNADQARAVEQLGGAVAARRFAVHVLHGVTGSGKTEVYIHAIRRALADGRQAIMLVPEISLTTQTVDRLRRRFERVAVLHSGLGAVERARTWEAIAAGRAPVVVGTRSAVFAPCPDLGVIVVDEEPEGSYKNLAAPRYHTRDVAIKRAHLESIPVVLGSATPSLETWLNLRRLRHYKLIRLPHRVRGLAMPSVHLVDMRSEHRERRGVHLLSRAMEWHLGETLRRREQAVLLLNRRGFASFLFCPVCQAAVQCPHCSVHMVFHATTELAHCHYCHARLAVPSRCQMAGCGGTLVRFGIGTQRVEAELREKFPSARVQRMDSDSMESPEDYAAAFTAFERRESDVLVGTQMIAKGLDFPFVSFVGVVSADTALGLDDFRSEERTFQLVLQVAGRSGRGDVGGHVVVQTFAADTHSIQHAVRGDYEAFAERELEARARNRLPPTTRMVRIVLSDPRMTRVQAAAEALSVRVSETLHRIGVRARVFDPHPSPVARMRDTYRFDVLLVFDTAKDLLKALDRFKADGTLHARVHGVMVDVDPVSLQ